MKADFAEVGKKQTLNEAVDALTPLMGATIMAKAAGDLGLQPSAVIGPSSPQVPELGNSSHSQNPPWYIQQQYKATVAASVHLKKQGRNSGILRLARSRKA